MRFLLLSLGLGETQTQLFKYVNRVYLENHLTQTSAGW